MIIAASGIVLPEKSFDAFGASVSRSDKVWRELLWGQLTPGYDGRVVDRLLSTEPALSDEEKAVAAAGGDEGLRCNGEPFPPGRPLWETVAKISGQAARREARIKVSATHGAWLGRAVGWQLPRHVPEYVVVPANYFRRNEGRGPWFTRVSGVYCVLASGEPQAPYGLYRARSIRDGQAIELRIAG